MLKIIIKKLHLIKILVCCCFLISYNFTNAQTGPTGPSIQNVTICLGDSVLIHGSSLFGGPIGAVDPDLPTLCTQVTNTSISPMDGVINQTGLSFWVSPTVSTTYTINSTATSNLVTGSSGVSCWDTNGNGLNDGDEDTNGDGLYNAADCQGATATCFNCWDTNGNGLNDENEDANGDGLYNTADCPVPGVGPQGIPGPSGAVGVNSISCWDTNGNGLNDGNEDTNGDGFYNAADCPCFYVPCDPTGPTGTTPEYSYPCISENCLTQSRSYQFNIQVIDDCTEPITNYPWLNDLIDQNNCCNNLAILEFPMTMYSFIYVKVDEECGGLGTLYLNNGTLYCNDASNFDCLGAYGLNESVGNSIYNCGEDTIEQPDTNLIDFAEYPWLNDIIDKFNCCTNEKIIDFPMGDYSFLYIEPADECGDFGTFYRNDGTFYCQDAPNFDCLGAYGLTQSDGITIWSCGSDYPWLPSVIDMEDCCANANVFYYKKDDCTHGYIYIKAGDCNDNNYGRLYEENGQLYCTSTATVDCFQHYDLGSSFIEELLWSCDGTDNRPYQSIDNGNSRLVSENISLGLNIFPNPSAGLINIEINTNKDYEGEQIISVYDINGRIVHQNRFDTANVKLFQADLSDLTNGIYIVEYKNANVSSVEKIMIRD